MDIFPILMDSTSKNVHKREVETNHNKGMAANL